MRGQVRRFSGRKLLTLTILGSLSPAAYADSPPDTPPLPDSAPGLGATTARPELVARPVSAEEAVQVAFQYHANAAVAEENLAASRARVREVRTGTLPRVNGEVSFTGRGNSALRGAFGPTRTQDDFRTDFGPQPRVSVQYNLYDGGQTRQAIRQARAGVDGSQAGLVATRNNLAFTVINNYLRQLQSERLLELRTVQVEVAKEQLRQVDARIETGAAAAADRALPLSTLRIREVDLRVAQNNVLVSANTLRNSMGLEVGPPLRLVEVQEDASALLPLESLRDVAIRQRPEVAQDEASTRASQASVSIARIGRKPRVDTAFGFNLTPNNVVSRSDFVISTMISMPLWDAGLTHAREQQARNQAQIAAIRLEQTRRDVSADVQEAYLNLVTARERFQVSKLAAEASQVNLTAQTERYARGANGVTVVDLIQAQEQFATANNNTIAALYDILRAQAQLNLAIGRY